MPDARLLGYRQVQSGLRLLLWTFGLSALLYVANRVVFYVLFDLRVRAEGLADLDVITIVSRGFQAAWLGVAIAQVVGAAQLASLPGSPVARGLPGPYRGAPDALGASPLRPLGRAVLGLLGLGVGLQVLGIAVEELLPARPRAEGPGPREMMWLLESVVSASGLAALAVWAARAARAAGRALAGSLWIGLLAVVVVRALLIGWRVVAQVRTADLGWYPWLTLVLAIAQDLGFCALLWRTGEALLAQERGEAGEIGEAGASAGRSRRAAAPADAVLWLDVGAAIRGYAGTIKVRLGVLLGGYLLLVGVGLSGDKEAVKALLLLLPVAAGVIGVIMLVFLARLLRVPAVVGGDGPALLGLILVLLSMLADLYAFSLVLDLTGDRLYRAFDAMERMPYVEVGSQALSLAALMSLLTAFRRIAGYLGEAGLAARCGATAVLLAGLMVAAIAVRAMIAVRVVRGEAVLVLAVPLLIGAVVGLVRYLGVLRDLQAAVDRYAYGGGGGDGPAAAAV